MEHWTTIMLDWMVVNKISWDGVIALCEMEQAGKTITLDRERETVTINAEVCTLEEWWADTQGFAYLICRTPERARAMLDETVSKLVR